MNILGMFDQVLFIDKKWYYLFFSLIEYSHGSELTLKPLNDEMLGDFIGKTLKYLYLTLADDHLLPLDRWILNDDGNPLPICGNEPIYPKKMCYNEWS